MVHLLISSYVNFPFSFHKQLLDTTFEIPHAHGRVPVTWVEPSPPLPWADHHWSQGRQVAGKGWSDPLQHPTSPGNRWCLHPRSNGRRGWGDGRMVMHRIRCLHRAQGALKKKRRQCQGGTLKEETHKPLPKPSSCPEELPHVEEYI